MSPEEREPRSSGRPTSGDEAEEGKSQNMEGYKETGEDFARADPDVLLDVPRIYVEELSLEVEELKARVALRTRLSELLEIDVGLDVSLGAVKLEIKGVEAEVQLKARLDNVQAMIERTLSSVDANPGLIQDLTNLSKSASRSGEEEDEQSTLQRDAPSEGRYNPSAGITDAAREEAEELGLDLASLEGTGSGGRIILKDVRRASRNSAPRGD
ncbi:hypothetical protein BH20ACT11_BH20ACT11_00020 [soil metagenome]